MKKNLKKDKTITKILLRNWKLMQNNIPLHQQVNPDANFLQQKEEESRQYEQQSYLQVNSDLVDCLLLLQGMQKELHDIRKSMKEMAKSIEEHDDTILKMEKKQKKQADKIDSLCQKVSAQKMKSRKCRTQIKQLKKIICYMGALLGINTISDNLEKILKKCSDKIGPCHVLRKAKKGVIDTTANFIDLEGK